MAALILWLCWWLWWWLFLSWFWDVWCLMIGIQYVSNDDDDDDVKKKKRSYILLLCCSLYFIVIKKYSSHLNVNDHFKQIVSKRNNSFYIDFILNCLIPFCCCPVWCICEENKKIKNHYYQCIYLPAVTFIVIQNRPLMYVFCILLLIQNTSVYVYHHRWW